MITPEVSQDQPIVRIEDPSGLYRVALSSLPHLYRPEDPGLTTESGIQFQNETEARGLLIDSLPLSNGGYLGEDLIADLDTRIVLSWRSKNVQPTAQIRSTLFLGKNEKRSPTQGFYKVDRAARVLGFVKQALPEAHLFEDRDSLQIRIPTGDDTQAILDLGPSNSAHLAEAASGLVGAILETATPEQKANLPNIKLSLIMTNNNDEGSLAGSVPGGFNITTEDDFVGKLKTYEKVYETVLRALYKEKGIPFPNEQIVIKLPDKLLDII